MLVSCLSYSSALKMEVTCSSKIMGQLASRTAIVNCFILVNCLVYNSKLKMEATYSSETSVDFQRSIRRYYRRDRTLHIQRCENLRSHMPTICFHIMIHFIFIYVVLKYFTAHLCMYKALNLTYVSEVKKKVKTLSALIIMKVSIDIYWKS
jgi:hypothetical protein